MLNHFQRNNNDIISKRMMFEIVPKEIILGIVPLETIMTSFSGNDNVESFSKK